jgi:hypothetical protein
MSKHKPPVPWRVYGGQPAAADFPNERAARKFARKLARLGIHADLYSADADGTWLLRYSHLDGEHEVTETQS